MLNVPGHQGFRERTWAELFAGLVLLGGAAILALYWYVQNALEFGNPFFPTTFQIFGQSITSKGANIGQQGTFSWASLFLSLRDLVEVKLFSVSTYTPDLTQMTGWGFFVLCCGLPACICAVISNRAFRIIVGCFLLSLASLFGWVANDPWNLRFALWFAGVFPIGFGMFIDSVAFQPLKSFWIAMATVCLVLDLIGVWGSGYRKADWIANIGHPLSTRTMRRQFGYTEIDLIPHGVTLGYCGDEGSPLYVMIGPEFSHRLVYLPLTNTTELSCIMRTEHIKYFCMCSDQSRQMPGIEEEVRAGHLKQLGRHVFVLPDAQEEGQ